MDQVNSVLMQNALDWMKAEYGGAEGYLKQALGLDDTQLTALRDIFLESPAMVP